MYQDISLVGQASGIPVSIAHRNRCNPGPLCRDKRTAVTHRRSRVHPFHMDHMAYKLHGRAQGNQLLSHLVRRIQPISSDSCPHHIHIRLPQVYNACAVGTVVIRSRDSKAGKLLLHPQKFPKLPSGIRLIRLIRPCEMGIHTLDDQIRHPADFLNPADALLLCRKAEP